MLALIVARSLNGVIGKEGRIPWRIPGEQSQFRQLTEGECVVMGRKTYEEIGRPLPRRLNIVVSSIASYEGENLLTVPTLRAAIDAAGERDIYISGGAALFREAMPLAEKLYVTEVELIVEDGDVFFPDIPPGEFALTVGEWEGGDVRYRRTEYTRIKRDG